MTAPQTRVGGRLPIPTRPTEQLWAIEQAGIDPIRLEDPSTGGGSRSSHPWRRRIGQTSLTSHRRRVSISCRPEEAESRSARALLAAVSARLERRLAGMIPPWISTTTRRAEMGDVVLVDSPFSDASASKHASRRPLGRVLPRSRKSAPSRRPAGDVQVRTGLGEVRHRDDRSSSPLPGSYRSQVDVTEIDELKFVRPCEQFIRVDPQLAEVGPKMSDADDRCLEEQKVLLAGLGQSVGWDDPVMDIYTDL